MDVNCEAVLSAIRYEFCVGETGELKERTAAMRKMLAGSVERLAADLYATSTHFIMELIQNADDNDYAREVNPYIQFILRPGYLIVCNNEQGFEEKHVRAICAVNQSTKTHQQGYIGEKGIGFKSVFVWTDEPHVLSNGYDFKFRHGQISGNELGFLVPYFPCQNAWPQVDLESVRRTAKTLFYLPFRERGEHNVHEVRRPQPRGARGWRCRWLTLHADIAMSQALRELTMQFESNLKPESVLFLRKLNMIRLWYPVLGRTDRILRVDYLRKTDPNGVDVSVTQTSQEVLAVNHQLVHAKEITHHYRRGVFMCAIGRNVARTRTRLCTTFKRYGFQDACVHPHVAGSPSLQRRAQMPAATIRLQRSCLRFQRTQTARRALTARIISSPSCPCVRERGC